MIKAAYALALSASLALSAAAQFTETFSYPDGPLTVVSGGVWEKWDPATSGDAQVVNGIATILDPTDVMVRFPNPFATSNNAVIEFDLGITAGNITESYFMYFMPSGSPGSHPVNGSNYNEGFLLWVDPPFNPAPAPGSYYVGFAANDAASGTIFVELEENFLYTFRIEGTRDPSTGDVATTISVAGTVLWTDSFRINDPRGLNALEIYTDGDAQGSPLVPGEFLALDNLNIRTSAPAIPGDTDTSGCVDDADLTNIILDFGAAGGSTSGFAGTDINNDGIVDDADLTDLILNFGSGC